jgi:uncharacterized membrane protein YphA (DoxX/SURF4 family)
MKILAIWLLTTLLVALFVFAGGGKLTATDDEVRAFEHFGYAPWFRNLIGVIQIAAGLCLLFPRTALLGAFGLLPIMAGATWTLWRVGDSVLPPVIVGGLLAVLAWLRWSVRPPAPASTSLNEEKR